MNLTPEQKEIGKENFLAALGSKALRRDFLKKSAAAELASGKGMGAYYFHYGTVDQPVKIAVLGTGDEGSVLIGGLNPKYVQVVAIADEWTFLRNTKSRDPNWKLVATNDLE